MAYPIKLEENHAAATSNWTPVSFKKSRIVAKKINGMPVYKAKAYLNGLIAGTIKLDDGKHNTSASKAILNTLESAEKNAKYKNFSEKLRIRTIACEAGPKRYRVKKLKRGGTGGAQMKICHIKVVIEDIQPKTEDKKTDAKAETKPEPKSQSKPTEKSGKK